MSALTFEEWCANQPTCRCGHREGEHGSYAEVFTFLGWRVEVLLADCRSCSCGGFKKRDAQQGVRV